MLSLSKVRAAVSVEISLLGSDVVANPFYDKYQAKIAQAFAKQSIFKK